MEQESAEEHKNSVHQKTIVTFDQNVSFGRSLLIQSCNLADTSVNTPREFEFLTILGNVFNPSFFEAMISKDALLKIKHDCVVSENKDKCKRLSKNSSICSEKTCWLNFVLC